MSTTNQRKNFDCNSKDSHGVIEIQWPPRVGMGIGFGDHWGGRKQRICETFGFKDVILAADLGMRVKHREGYKQGEMTY